MTLAMSAAPQIDRLVLSVNHPLAWDDLERAGHDAGLDNLGFVLHWWDFLLAGVLTTELAKLRSRYRTGESIEARIDELQGKGLIESGATGWTASPGLVPLLGLVGEEQRRVATDAWSEHGDVLDEVTAIADELSESATDDHVVAVVHREMPRPDDPFHGLHHRLTTLRYVRQHDHAEAWGAEGLAAQDMVVMTSLWHGEGVDGDPAVLENLGARGYVEGHPPALTEQGLAVRESIEEVTNRRAQTTFDILDDVTGASLLNHLETLPSA